jgi:hypothetical protein
MRKHSMLGIILEETVASAAVALFVMMIMVWADVVVRGLP